jgi:16S rRNA C967 or C1407 C5-methylase (RsmB/RsmF family)
MQGEGRITAFDADHRRLKRLKANAAATGAANIVAKHADFLSVAPAEYPHVRAILLDPSCSGSGTEVVRGDILLRGSGSGSGGGGGGGGGDDIAAAEQEQSSAEARVEALASFQVGGGLCWV